MEFNDTPLFSACFRARVAFLMLIRFIVRSTVFYSLAHKNKLERSSFFDTLSSKLLRTFRGRARARTAFYADLLCGAAVCSSALGMMSRETARRRRRRKSSSKPNRMSLFVFNQLCCYAFLFAPVSSPSSPVEHTRTCIHPASEA